MSLLAETVSGLPNVNIAARARLRGRMSAPVRWTSRRRGEWRVCLETAASAADACNSGAIGWLHHLQSIERYTRKLEPGAVRGPPAEWAVGMVSRYAAQVGTGRRVAAFSVVADTGPDRPRRGHRAGRDGCWPAGWAQRCVVAAARLRRFSVGALVSAFGSSCVPGGDGRHSTGGRREAARDSLGGSGGSCSRASQNVRDAGGYMCGCGCAHIAPIAPAPKRSSRCSRRCTSACCVAGGDGCCTASPPSRWRSTTHTVRYGWL